MWRPRPAHMPYRVEVQETRSCGQYDPCREQGRGTTPQGIPDNGKHGHGPQNRHGGAPQGERLRSSGDARRRNKAPACRSWHAIPGVRSTRSACGAHHPLAGWKTKVFGAMRREKKGKGEEEDEVGT